MREQSFCGECEALWRSTSQTNMPNSMDAPSRNPTWQFKILLLNDVFSPMFFVCCLDLISHGENLCNPSFNDGIPRFDGEIPVSVGYNKSAGILVKSNVSSFFYAFKCWWLNVKSQMLIRTSYGGVLKMGIRSPWLNLQWVGVPPMTKRKAPW